MMFTFHKYLIFYIVLKTLVGVTKRKETKEEGYKRYGTYERSVNETLASFCVYGYIIIESYLNFVACMNPKYIYALVTTHLIPAPLYIH